MLSEKDYFTEDVDFYSCYKFILNYFVNVIVRLLINLMCFINEGFVNVVCRLEGVVVMIFKIGGIKNYFGELLV